MNEAIAIHTLQQKCNRLLVGDLSIQIYYWGAQSDHQDTPLHKHSFLEICYVNSGTGLYWEGDQNYVLQEGTFICSRPNKLHKIYNGKNLYLYWVAFEVNNRLSTSEEIYLFQELAQTDTIVIPDAEYSFTTSLWEGVMMHAANKHSDELLSSLSYSLLLSLQSLFCGRKDKGENQERELPQNAIINHAQLFICDNLTMPLNLEDVAQYLHISSRHLSRLFRQHLDITFTTFLRQERIRAAAEKLRHSDLPIKSISELYCFSSVHYFTRVFTEEVSKTPGEYRKLTKK